MAMKDTNTDLEIVSTFNGGFTIVEHLPQHLLNDPQFCATHDYDYAWFNWRVHYDTFDEAWRDATYIKWLEELHNS